MTIPKNVPKKPSLTVVVFYGVQEFLTYYNTILAHTLQLVIVSTHVHLRTPSTKP